MSILHSPHTCTSFSEIRSVSIIVLFIVGLIGCATDAPKTPGYFAIHIDSHAPKISRIALVTDLTPPEIESVDLGFTRGEGAAGGFAGGAASGAGLSLVAVAEAGAAGAAVFVLLLPVFVVGGIIVGTVTGVATGYSADMLADAEASARVMLNSAYLQIELLEHAREYALENTNLEFIRMPGADPKTLEDEPDYKVLSAESIDAVLEVELLRFKLEDFLEVEARARLISTQTGEVLGDANYKFLSERHRLKEWIADDAALLTEAIIRGLQSLAEDIVDENFLLFYPNEPEEIVSQQTDKTSDPPQAFHDLFGDPVPHYVLSPEYPMIDFCGLFSAHSAIATLKFVEVDSIQPTLRWEGFPRDYDLINADGQPQQITDVRYDLRIFNTTTPSSGSHRMLIPSKQVYDARNISIPYHKIENKLEKCTNYFWTVRARFKLDDNVRVTEWAGAFDALGSNERPWNLRHGLHAYTYPIVEWMLPARPPIADGPEWYYYPFSTPCDLEKSLGPTNIEQDNDEF